ncbi:MAG: hypothetical protein AB8H79_22520 [Myxococcota bacterium]
MVLLLALTTASVPTSATGSADSASVSGASSSMAEATVEGEPAALHRYELQSTLLLPRPLWLLADTNDEARVSEVSLELSLSCGWTAQGKDHVVDCVIEGAAVRAAPMPSDRGRAAVVLEQLDARLTGANVQFRTRRGRVMGLWLQNREGPMWRRTRRADENTRLLLSRAVAGFDMHQPKSGVEADNAWGQRRSWWAQAPAASGTLGTAELVHQSLAGDTRIEVRTSGNVTLSPSTGSGETGVDWYTGKVRAQGHVDAQGLWLDRRWALSVSPSPDSAIANGPAGLSYDHTGSLRRLASDEAVALGPTGEVEPSRAQPTALQSRDPLGMPR